MVSYARELDHYDALRESVWRGMPDSTAAFFVNDRANRNFYLLGRLGTVSGVAGVGIEAAAARNEEDKRYRQRNDILFNTFTNSSSYMSFSQMLENFFSYTFQEGLDRRVAQVARKTGIDVNDAQVRSEIDQAIDQELGGAEAVIASAAPSHSDDVDGAAQRLAEVNPNAIEAIRDRLCDSIESDESGACSVASDSDIGLLLLQRAGDRALPRPELKPAPSNALILAR